MQLALVASDRENTFEVQQQKVFKPDSLRAGSSYS